MNEPLRGVARHHTKDKGDLGVACVIADLMKAGIRVAMPISEHLPFDLLAIGPDGAIAKIQVKFVSMSKWGTLIIPGRTNWSDRHGVHHKPHQPGDYDAIAVYCPDTDRCYYVAAREMQCQSPTLRILDAKNRQQLRVRKAENFTDPRRVFPGACSSAG